MPVTREELVRLVQRERLRDGRIADAFMAVDRAWFVPSDLVVEAYSDRPVALPEHQTTSQPTLIARMIDAAAPRPEDVVLEVGTGYGFQTALLARLCARVISIERHAVLADAARENLERARIANAQVVVGDGWNGWPEGAPYGAIVVSAAAAALPRALGDQLEEGGRLVIPLARGTSDDVVLFQKVQGALVETRLVTPARFVPLVHRDVGAGGDS